MPRLFQFLVFVVGYLFHPINDFPVEGFLNSDMCHGDGRTCAMPMLLIWFEPDHIARPDFFDGTTRFLHSAEAGRDDQRLSERMRMPRGPRAGLKTDARAASAGRIGRLKKRIDANRSGEIFVRTFCGGP